MQPKFPKICLKVEGKKKGKGILITGQEGPWGMLMQGSTNTQPQH